MHPKQILYHLTTKPFSQRVEEKKKRKKEEKREKKRKRSRWGSNPRSFAPEANAFPLRHRTMYPSKAQKKERRERKEKTREEKEEKKEKKGLCRESNPGHPHPKRVFYHLTTKPDNLERKKE